MVNPIGVGGARPIGPLQPVQGTQSAGSTTDEKGFADSLKAQLEKVSEMQTDAETGIEKLLTGESQNVTEVFAAARKAEVAFSLLMEIRNKLNDAYGELRRIQT